MKTFHTPVLAIFLCLITHLFFPSNVKAQTVDYLKIGDTYVFSSSHSEYLALHYLKCEKNQVAELKAGAHATSSFKVVAGLAGGNSISLESVQYPGHYLRHQGFELKLHPNSSDDLFKKDASFKQVKGLANNQEVSLEAVNLPEHYILHKNFKYYVEKSDGSSDFPVGATHDFINETKRLSQSTHQIQQGTSYTFTPKNLPNHSCYADKNQIASLKTTASISDKSLSSFKVVAGLTGTHTISLQSVKYPDHYLRHANLELKLVKGSSDETFKRDASFYAIQGLADVQQVSFESMSFPDFYIRHKDSKLYVKKSDNSADFHAHATFGVANPLASNTASNSNTGSGTSTSSNTGSGASTSSGSTANSNTGSGSNTSSGSTANSNTSSGASTNNLLKQDNTYAFLSINYPAKCFHCQKDQNCSLKATKDITDNALSQYKIVAGLDGGATISFESIKHPGHYLRNQDKELKLQTGTNDSFKKEASFKVVKGLADKRHLSFEAVHLPNHYIRHSGFKLFVHKTDNSPLFKGDATFVAYAVETGNTSKEKFALNTIHSFESYNLPEHYLQSSMNRIRVSKVYNTNNPNNESGYEKMEKVGASFHMINGLYGIGTVSFHSVTSPGHYLVFKESKLQLVAVQTDDLGLAMHASFKIRDGLADPKWISFESVSISGAYIRHKNRLLYIEKPNGNSTQFNEAATFKQRKGFSDLLLMPSNNAAKALKKSEDELCLGVPIRMLADMYKILPGPLAHTVVLSRTTDGQLLYDTSKNIEYAPTNDLVNQKISKEAVSFKIVPGLTQAHRFICFESVQRPGQYIFLDWLGHSFRLNIKKVDANSSRADKDAASFDPHLK